MHGGEFFPEGKPKSAPTPAGRALIRNRAKALAVVREKSLRQAATWDCTRGNRRKTNEDEVFVRANEFRGLLDRRELTLDELETWIFNRWASPSTESSLLFADVDPPSGG